MDKDFSFKVEQSQSGDKVMISFKGNGFTFNINNFFDFQSVITFIPKECVGDLATQLSFIAEDIAREKAKV